MALKIEVSADKFLYSFYKYLPTKYEASKQEWAVRQLIWDFKNGKGGFEVGKMVAEKISCCYQDKDTILKANHNCIISGTKGVCAVAIRTKIQF